MTVSVTLCMLRNNKLDLDNRERKIMCFFTIYFSNNIFYACFAILLNWKTECFPLRISSNNFIGYIIILSYNTLLTVWHHFINWKVEMSSSIHNITCTSITVTHCILLFESSHTETWSYRHYALPEICIFYTQNRNVYHLGNICYIKRKCSSKPLLA